MTIFISIASFCDPVLDFTIKQAIKMAKYPNDIHFGIVEQNYSELALAQLPNNASYLLVNPQHSRGACWARSLAMSMYGNQDWFFQIDSHMDFDLHWDDKLIGQATELQRFSLGVVISSYPNPFVFENGLAIKKPVTSHILANMVKHGTVFEDGLYTLQFEAHHVNGPDPIHGFHIGAGCLFTSGNFVNHFPYDPQLYFVGEEQTLSARIFTHGWDIFHTPGLPIYHLYNTTTNHVPRILHWDKSIDSARDQSWVYLEQISKRRIAALFSGNGVDLGAYGLGNKRSLNQFKNLSGIDYSNMTVLDRAYGMNRGH